MKNKEVKNLSEKLIVYGLYVASLGIIYVVKVFLTYCVKEALKKEE
jgi:hypothetical protein